MKLRRYIFARAVILLAVAVAEVKGHRKLKLSKACKKMYESTLLFYINQGTDNVQYRLVVE